MAKITPQYDLLKIVNKLTLIGRVIFWVIFIFSLSTIILKDFCTKYNLFDFIYLLNIVCLVLFFMIEIINDFIIIPKADDKRRDDFIDNSFNSFFSTTNSIDYFDNDKISHGLYKASVNLFQNCFYSYSLIKKTTILRTIIPLIVFISMIIFSYSGFKENPLALVILQVFFSANILGLLIKHLILITRLSTIQNSWITLFQNNDLKSDTNKYQSHIYKYWLQYEVLISKINIGVSNKVFSKFNQSLTTEWNNMKTRYNIN